MGISKEQKRARFMMHVNLIIGTLSFIVFVMAITLKSWLTAVVMVLCGVSQYFSYKQWQKKA